MLKYSLFENFLTKDPNDYWGQVTQVRSYDLDEIIEMMLKRGSLLTETDIKANLTMFNTVVTDVVSNGDAVVTPLFNAYPSISGVFNSVADSFDPARHRVRINLNPGIMLTQAQRTIKTEKVQTGESLPSIIEVKDVASGSVNDVITAGGILNITGSKIRFMENAETNGVFFINSENGSETKMTMISDNKPSRIIGLAPATLPQGTYWIEVRTSYVNLKEKEGKLKSYRFSKLLTL